MTFSIVCHSRLAVLLLFSVRISYWNYKVSQQKCGSWQPNQANNIIDVWLLAVWIGIWFLFNGCNKVSSYCSPFFFFLWLLVYGMKSSSVFRFYGCQSEYVQQSDTHNFDSKYFFLFYYYRRKSYFYLFPVAIFSFCFNFSIWFPFFYCETSAFRICLDAWSTIMASFCLQNLTRLKNATNVKSSRSTHTTLSITKIKTFRFANTFQIDSSTRRFDGCDVEFCSCVGYFFAFPSVQYSSQMSIIFFFFCNQKW